MCNFLCASQERPYFACKLLKLSTLVRSCSSSMPNPWSWNHHQTMVPLSGPSNDYEGGWSYEVEGYQSWDWIMDINKGGWVHAKTN